MHVCIWSPILCPRWSKSWFGPIIISDLGQREILLCKFHLYVTGAHGFGSHGFMHCKAKIISKMRLTGGQCLPWVIQDWSAWAECLFACAERTAYFFTPILSQSLWHCSPLMQASAMAAALALQCDFLRRGWSKVSGLGLPILRRVPQLAYSWIVIKILPWTPFCGIACITWTSREPNVRTHNQAELYTGLIHETIDVISYDQCLIDRSKFEMSTTPNFRCQ